MFPLRYISDRVSRLSIRYRFMLYTLIGLVPIVLLSAYSLRYAYRARLQQAFVDRLTMAEMTAGAVREFVDGITRAQHIIGLTIEREDLTHEEMISCFEDTRGAIPILDTIGFALPSGAVVAGQPEHLIGIDIADREHFREIAAGREWAVSPLLASRPTGRPAFVIARRVERDGAFSGVLFSAVSPEVLERFVTARAAPEIDYGILDSTGRIIVTTVLAADLAPEQRDRSWIPSVQKALRGESALAEPFVDRADGVERMGASLPVPEVGWVVNVFEPVSTAMAPLRSAALLDLASHILMIAVVLVAAWIVGARIARPVTALARRADAVARGDFSQRIETRDRAELGTLAGAFNNMTAELSRISAEQRRAQERASFLADIGELLTSTLDPNVALQKVTERTVEIAGDLAVVLRIGPDGRLDRVVGHSRDPAVLETVDRLARERPPEVGSGVAGTAIEKDQTIFVPRVSELEDPERRFYLEQVNAVSTIAVPMRIRGAIMGAFSVSSTRDPLTEKHVEIVEELARRLEIALEHIGLYEDALEREELQKGLSELAGAVGSTLETRVVLEVICTRARDLLHTDGVYIWVLEPDQDRLVGAAGCGFKAQEFVGMSLPLTERDAVAVQVLRRREGAYAHDLPGRSDLSCTLTEAFCVAAGMFQPLISAGVPLGVMVITDTKEPNRFDESSLARAGLLAGYAATALANARAYERERRIAETLQRSLLADIPERVDHFELAHFYTPAYREAAIGGDFYDFIEIGDGRYGLVVGDVSGKGLEAAVVTAMAKYLVRAYVAEDPEPGRVLARANNGILKYTGPELFITLVYGLLEAGEGQLRYASAGHEPMLIYRDKEKRLDYASPTGVAAGLVQTEEYRAEGFALSAGDMLVMYTDGLTDARSPDGEFLGTEGLAKLVLELAGGSASEFLHTLMDRVTEYTGGEFADDVVIVAVRAARGPHPSSRA